MLDPTDPMTMSVDFSQEGGAGCWPGAGQIWRTFCFLTKGLLIYYFYNQFRSMSIWSRGMIPASGAGGPGFNPRNGPSFCLCGFFRRIEIFMLVYGGCYVATIPGYHNSPLDFGFFFYILRNVFLLQFGGSLNLLPTITYNYLPLPSHVSRHLFVVA
jgi:hypothetical protein